MEIVLTGKLPAGIVSSISLKTNAAFVLSSISGKLKLKDLRVFVFRYYCPKTVEMLRNGVKSATRGVNSHPYASAVCFIETAGAVKCICIWV